LSDIALLLFSTLIVMAFTMAKSSFSVLDSEMIYVRELVRVYDLVR